MHELSLARDLFPFATMRPLGMHAHLAHASCSVEEAEHLPSNPLPACLLMVDDARRGREHNEAELARGQQPPDPVLDLPVPDVVAR